MEGLELAKAAAESFAEWLSYPGDRSLSGPEAVIATTFLVGVFSIFLASVYVSVAVSKEFLRQNPLRPDDGFGRMLFLFIILLLTGSVPVLVAMIALKVLF